MHNFCICLENRVFSTKYIFWYIFRNKAVFLIFLYFEYAGHCLLVRPFGPSWSKGINKTYLMGKNHLRQNFHKCHYSVMHPITRSCNGALWLALTWNWLGGYRPWATCGMALQPCWWVNSIFWTQSHQKQKRKFPEQTNTEICGTNAEIHGMKSNVVFGFDPRCFGPFVGTDMLHLYPKCCTLVMFQ